MSKLSPFFSSSISITIISLSGLFISFISQIIIAFYFGTSAERDAYFLASIIPAYFTGVIIGSLGIMFLPKFIEIRSTQSPKEAMSFFISYFYSLVAFSILFILLFFFLSRQIVELVLPDGSHFQLYLTRKILLVLFPTVLFINLNSALTSYLQVKGLFIKSAFTQLIIPITSITVLILFQKQYGIISLAYGSLLGSFLTFFVLMILSKINLFFRPVDFSLHIKSIYLIAFPLLFSGIIARATSLVERIISSNLGAGNVSYLGYSSQILLLLTTLTTSGIAVTIYPRLSEMWANGNRDEFVKLFSKGINSLLFLVIPLSCYVLLFRLELIRAIFERGAFSIQDAENVSLALLFSVGAFISLSLGSIVAKAFYIAGQTLRISIISTIELAIYLILSILLIDKYSFIGLSIALSVSSALNVIFSIFIINKKIFKLDFYYHAVYSLKILTASIFSVMLSWFFMNYSLKIFNLHISLFISMVVGFSSFIIANYFLKTEPVQSYLISFFNKIKFK